MTLRINERLNLVLPIERLDGSKVYIHAMPIGVETFDQYFLVIGQTFTMITGGKLGIIGGPRLAWRLLRKAAQDLGTWDGPDGVEQGLVGEMIRLASLIAPGKTNGGWEAIPLETALNQGLIDEEDKDMALNALVFFSVSCAMLPRRMNGENFRKDYLEGASRLWAAQTSSLDCTAYVASLKTSIGAAGNTGATPSAV